MNESNDKIPTIGIPKKLHHSLRHILSDTVDPLTDINAYFLFLIFLIFY